MPRKITILFRYPNLGEDKSLILCISLVTSYDSLFVSNFANLNFLSALLKLAKGLPILLIFSKNSSFLLILSFMLLLLLLLVFCFYFINFRPNFCFSFHLLLWGVILSFSSRDFVSCVIH